MRTIDRIRSRITAAVSVPVLALAGTIALAPAAHASSTFSFDLVSLQAINNGTAIRITFNYSCDPDNTDTITMSVTVTNPAQDAGTGTVTYTSTTCDGAVHTASADDNLITDAAHSGDTADFAATDTQDRTGHNDRDDVSVLSDFLNDAHIL